jgi:hypothetical protein
MDDVISRQAAIDACHDYEDGEGAYAYGFIVEERLRNLPSAQPEQAVKGCRNCKYGKYNDHWKTHFCYNPNECTEWNLWEPSAQPERKKGEWITNFYAFGEDRYECDQCHNTALHRYDFCPNCGANMRGGQNDEQGSTNND